MPLTMAAVGESHSILKVTGRDEMRRHLEEMGFTAGSRVEIVSEIGGNLILAVKDSRVALNKSMAMRIIV